jgi:hypothetical protein
MISDPFLLVFCGGLGGSPVEEEVATALRACALDTLEEALGTGGFAGAAVVADRPSADYLEPHLPKGVLLDVDAPGEPFHFGRRLTQVVQRLGLERPVYIGCGMPLIKADEFAAVSSALASADLLVVCNNYYSADFIGFVPGRAVNDLDLPDNDRILPRFLVQEGGLVNQSLPRTIQNQFDIDTPIDLAVLAYAGGAGKRLAAEIERRELDTTRLARAAWTFTDKDATVVVAGRVSAEVVQFLRSETACQVRFYSDERGMQAVGRDLSGEARTLLGYHLKAVGPRRFFEEIAEMAQAAFLDTRPLLAHLGVRPSRPDRFLSDALQPDGITDPWLRDFTRAAAEAPIPVVLGGQSLVGSGVQLLSEAAWKQHDRLEMEYRAKGRARDSERRSS